MTTKDTPGYTYAEGLTEGSARLTSELLTLNHDLFHTRWNADFHNHNTHHLLAMYSLGASTEELKDMWNYNAPYQAPIDRDHETVPSDLDLHDPAVFDACLGKDVHYIDFLEFFQSEIKSIGPEAVIRQYVLKGDARADDISCRMYTDLVHPMIHLGCAIEWRQSSVLAESLAGACVHENWPKEFLLPTEEYLRKNPDQAVKDDDPFNKIADGLMKRVNSEQFARHLSQFRVTPTEEDVQQKMSEMMHTAAYIMGAAQRPGKREKIDFVLLHNKKARILEGKGRVDAVMYAGCGCPDLYPERVTNYTPKNETDSWPELFHRSIVYRDEGHATKLIRSLYSSEQHFTEMGCELPIAKKDFVKIAHIAMDSIERSMQPGGTKMPKEVAETMAKNIGHGGEFVVANVTRWVFYDGLPKAWDNVPDLAEGVKPESLHDSARGSPERSEGL
ncbi:hypothetical protein CBER1_07835 [Cercospora berteroae]|uniref:Oxidoreductase AflY n=1 Tax=Cercospora berteroae TaxID=357750 RepID=A0A2S6BU68_9PEZI|nr:hypothetical protein CBER1_07835 [Cercospora berteroae]